MHDISHRYAVNLRKRVLYIHAQPVGQLENVHLILIAHEAQEAKHVTGAFANAVTHLLDFFRQFALYLLNGIGDVHHGHVVIGTGLEYQGE